ncbi:MAG: hypothetical protein L3J09_03900 [Flavobacteriaceae bacterium]|nr:hypothetical protein [Flavobacteriaceae bacterium]
MIAFIGTSFNSCYYDALPEDENLPSDGEETELVSYQTDIVPLWVQCIGCHKQGGDLPNMEDNSYNNLLNGYVIPENADGSILYKSLIGDGVELMPPGSGWPTAKIDLVKDWINQGALNN